MGDNTPQQARDPECLFCRIVSGEVDAAVVFSDADVLAFLDHRPLFDGHALVVPRAHHPTLSTLPRRSIAAYFTAVARIEVAVRDAMDAPGSFVAMNNTVSQSVPHLHTHVVPRRRKDGLRGFFWPRTRYESLEDMRSAARRIAAAIPPE